jgi:uncharacterized protein DUF4953/uncharacterized protein DUF5117
MKELEVKLSFENMRLNFVRWAFAVAVLGILIGFSPPASSQDTPQDGAEEKKVEEKKSDEAKDKKSEKKGKKDEEEEEEEETLEEVVKDYDKIEGLFTFYRNKEDGGLLMELSDAQLEDGIEYIYHGVTLNGAAEVGFGYILGSYRRPAILTFSKRYENIEIVKENPSFYFDPDNALSRASHANIQPALMAVASIMAKSEDGTRYLVDADSLFQSESLTQMSPSADPGHEGSSDFNPGGINSDKTHLIDVKSFARNSTVTVDFVFDNSAPSNYGEDDITDGRTVTITYQHSLIATPEPGFEPRLDDQRVGYFNQRITDLTDTSVTPYRDLINKWRLIKKDPSAALSEPVKPITYWIENTTPIDYRASIQAGVLAWNSAFEKAGFKNAVEAKIMPDDVDWDPADVDYNVIRWVSSPQPMYGGIGPRLANPRTGEILATDIVLEQVYATNRLIYTDIFDKAALPLWTEGDRPDLSKNSIQAEMCSAGLVIQQNTLFGMASLRAQGATEKEIGDLVKEGLFELALHEVGHTLGLMHNMKASQGVSYEAMHTAETKEKGYLSGSVMDYMAINVNADRSKQGLYYTVAPGPYDDWAIEFGYKPSLADPVSEAARVEALLGRSMEPALAFGNDADDMRNPAGGIDPRTMVSDLSDDAIQFAIDRMNFVDDRLVDLKSTYEKSGDTWDNLRTAYLILTGQKAIQSRVIVNYIGGVYLERTVIGQDGAKAPYTPVSGEDQRKAMAALEEYIFAPNAWQVSEDLVQHLQKKRRGYEQWGNEDPGMHARTIRMQSIALSVVLHPRNMQRMLDSTLYGNDYPPAEVLQDLTDAIFVADLRSRVNSHRQNLQLHYVGQLIAVASGDLGHSFPLQSAALHQLRRIERMERQAKSPDVATSAHRGHVRYWIETAIYGEASRQ